MENIDAICEFFTFRFVLGDKTFLIDHKIPEIDMPYRIEEKPTTWKDTSKALENSVIEICQKANHPCMLLSGGMDSRIIAGIMAENNFDILCYTIGTIKKEIAVSKAIAETLKLRHIVLTLPKPHELLDYNVLRTIALHTMGTLSIPYFLWRTPALKRVKAQSFITALYATELWADWITPKSKSLIDFCNMVYETRCRVQTLKKQYHQKALSNLLKYGESLDIKSAYYETYIKSRARTELYTVDKKPILTPFLNSEVLSSTFSLPIEMRQYKRINHLIIKHKFPKLASIPDVLPIKPKNKPFSYVKKRIRQVLNLRRKDVFDFDHLFRNNSDLKKYIRRGIPSISNKKICENIIDCFYNKKMDISKPMSCFLSYFFLKGETQTLQSVKD